MNLSWIHLFIWILLIRGFVGLKHINCKIDYIFIMRSHAHGKIIEMAPHTRPMSIARSFSCILSPFSILSKNSNNNNNNQYELKH